MNRYKKYLKEQEDKEFFHCLIYGSIEEAHKLAMKCRYKKGMKFYTELRNVLYNVMMLKIKEEQLRLANLEKLGIDYCTLEDAKKLNKEKEWHCAYNYAYRMFLSILPYDPYRCILYDNDLLEMSGLNEKNIRPTDIYMLIHKYENKTYEEINESIKKYKKKAHK